MVSCLSATDPKSTEDLRKLADRRRNGQHLSKNELYELDEARRTGVKNVFTDKDKK